MSISFALLIHDNALQNLAMTEITQNSSDVSRFSVKTEIIRVYLSFCDSAIVPLWDEDLQEIPAEIILFDTIMVRAVKQQMIGS